MRLGYVVEAKKRNAYTSHNTTILFGLLMLGIRSHVIVNISQEVWVFSFRQYDLNFTIHCRQPSGKIGLSLQNKTDRPFVGVYIQ